MILLLDRKRHTSSCCTNSADGYLLYHDVFKPFNFEAAPVETERNSGKFLQTSCHIDTGTNVILPLNSKKQFLVPLHSAIEAAVQPSPERRKEPPAEFTQMFCISISTFL